MLFILGVCGLFTHLAGATQADDTTITITAKNNGPTPFISQLTLLASDINAIKEYSIYDCAQERFSDSSPFRDLFARLPD